MTEIMEGVTAGEVISNYEGTGVNFTDRDKGIFHLVFIDDTTVRVVQSEYGYPHDTPFMWAGRDVTLGVRYMRRPDGLWVISGDAPYVSQSWRSKPLTPRMKAAIKVYLSEVVNAYLKRPEVAGTLLQAAVRTLTEQRDKTAKDEQEKYSEYITANHARVALDEKLRAARTRLVAHGEK